MEVFLRTNRFKTEDRQYCPSIGISLETPTASTSELMATASRLLRRIYRAGYKYKKTGLMLTGLVSEESYQPSLPFDQPKVPRIDIDKIVDEINLRMGNLRSPVITRALMGTQSEGRSWKMRSERHSPCYSTSWSDLPAVRI